MDNINTWEEAYEAYDDMLDEINGDAKIGNFTYSTSRALLEVDPIAYRTDFNEWADAEGIDTDQLDGAAYRH